MSHILKTVADTYMLLLNHTSSQPRQHTLVKHVLGCENTACSSIAKIALILPLKNCSAQWVTEICLHFIGSTISRKISSWPFLCRTKIANQYKTFVFKFPMNNRPEPLLFLFGIGTHFKRASVIYLILEADSLWLVILHQAARVDTSCNNLNSVLTYLCLPVYTHTSV